MKRIFTLLLVATLSMSLFALDIFKYVPFSGDVKSYTQTDFTITSKFGDLFRTPNMKIIHNFDANGNEVAYLYKWDGSGSEGDDLYFNASVNGETFTFTVESYLCGADTEVYKTVKNLEIGQKVDMEGFLYWYEGANPHITKVTVK